MNYYMADTPGRLRIESPALKGQTPDGQRFHDLVAAIPGVLSVEMKPIIGSATIHYDTCRIDHRQLIEILDKSGYFNHLQAKTPDECLEEGIAKATEVVVQAIEDEI